MNLNTVELRDAQKVALDFINNSNKKFIILDAPCGTGKSLIAMMLQGTKYIVTTKKSLQDQYYNDYWADLKILKGKATYQDEDEYKLKRDIAQDARNTCLNVYSAYYQFKYAPGWTEREWMIIDEAHNLQWMLQEMGSISMYIDTLKHEDDKDKEEYCYIPQHDEDGEITQYVRVPLKNVVPSNPENYVCRDGESMYSYFPGDRQVREDMNGFLIKREYVPINIRKNFLDMAYKGSKILIMSGTIINKEMYCKQLNIDPNMVDYLSMESPFLPDNRKIYNLNIGYVTYKNTDAIWDTIVEKVKWILDMYHDKRGIIHTVSYSLSQRLFESLQDNPKYSDRLLLKESSNIELLLREHSRKPDSVIIACGLEEGLDLKDDLARFQIILKMPFPALGDPLVKKMMEIDEDWYNYQTLKQLVQALGRIVRTETDYGDSYIIDSSFNRFYNMLPEYIKKAVYNVS